MQIEQYMENARKRLLDVEQAILRFDFGTADQRAYETLNRDYQRLTRLLERWRDAQAIDAQLSGNRSLLEAETDEEFRAVVLADIDTLDARRTALEREITALILPPHPNEGRNIIIEIRPAAGGAEAGLFAAELYRMYTRYAEEKGWRRETLEIAETELGGIKAVAFSVQGADAYGRLRHESGVHRVQRIPVTESGGRIHTSTVTVAVLPEAEEVDLHIAPEELHFDVFRSSGPGGQSVNTTDSAVRVTHLPTGMTVASQQEKSQHRNKEIALRILRSRLLDLKQAEETARHAAERRSQVGTGERSEKIRTYNFPQNRITDHRFGITQHNLSAVIEGDLDGLLDDIAATYAERRLSEEVR